MIVQLLTKRGELYQQLLMVLLFLGFIVYALYKVSGLSVYIFLSLIVFLGIAVYFLIRYQLNQKVGINPQLIWTVNKYQTTHYSWKWKIIPLFIVGLLTGIHFYIYYQANLSVSPLLWDYGIGALLGIGILYFQYKNWMVGICDEGVLVGTKIEMKLILWSNIKEVNKDNSTLTLTMEEGYPIYQIKLYTTSEEAKTFETLLKYKLPVE